MLPNAVRDEIVKLYSVGIGSTAIGIRLGVSNKMVLIVLKQRGVILRPQSTLHQCIDCGRKINQGWRCPIHRKMRNAELHLEKMWEIHGHKCKCGKPCIGKECRSCSNRRVMRIRRSKSREPPR